MLIEVMFLLLCPYLLRAKPQGLIILIKPSLKLYLVVFPIFFYKCIRTVLICIFPVIRVLLMFVSSLNLIKNLYELHLIVFPGSDIRRSCIQLPYHQLSAHRFNVHVPCFDNRVQRIHGILELRTQIFPAETILKCSMTFKR